LYSIFQSYLEPPDGIRSPVRYLSFSLTSEILSGFWLQYSPSNRCLYLPKPEPNPVFFSSIGFYRYWRLVFHAVVCSPVAPLLDPIIQDFFPQLRCVSSFYVRIISRFFSDRSEQTFTFSFSRSFWRQISHRELSPLLTFGFFFKFHVSSERLRYRADFFFFFHLRTALCFTHLCFSPSSPSPLALHRLIVGLVPPLVRRPRFRRVVSGFPSKICTRVHFLFES